MHPQTVIFGCFFAKQHNLFILVGPKLLNREMRAISFSTKVFDNHRLSHCPSPEKCRISTPDTYFRLKLRLCSGSNQNVDVHQTGIAGRTLSWWSAMSWSARFSLLLVQQQSLHMSLNLRLQNRKHFRLVMCHIYFRQPYGDFVTSVQVWDIYFVVNAPDNVTKVSLLSRNL